MVGAHKTEGIAILVAVIAFAVTDHVKLHIRRRRPDAPKTVVEERQLTLWREIEMFDAAGSGDRAARPHRRLCDRGGGSRRDILGLFRSAHTVSVTRGGVNRHHPRRSFTRVIGREG
ncbi:hypothetical protein MMARJ_14870 [Mycobacterium marseillense]|uniref:Secreted protein n=1 Tax=Mycobacterium marseillense TaxID=701042 RepID=A0ABM7JAE9_9MYCO|nr:hypothetical protein MMARJ_14870 [Mycobacterium marseillense]